MTSLCRTPPEVVPVLPEALSLRRTLWMIRPDGVVRMARPEALCRTLVGGLRVEIARAEGAA